MDLFIFGSCVSRDIFNYTTKHKVVDYFSRSSVISVVSEPMGIDCDLVHLDSPFRKRMVVRDLEKVFFNELSNSTFDYLIIDFVDERLDLLEMNSRYCTRSNELVSSGLEKYYEFNLLKKNSPSAKDVWFRACDIFVEKLTKIVPVEKIIVHKTTWAKSIIDENTSYEFDAKYQKFIETNNNLLNAFYDHFISLLPEVKVLEISRELRVANKNHRWGLAAFHYIDDYYLKALEDLTELSI